MIKGNAQKLIDLGYRHFHIQFAKSPWLHSVFAKDENDALEKVKVNHPLAYFKIKSLPAPKSDEIKQHVNGELSFIVKTSDELNLLEDIPEDLFR